jgi:2-haloacid dehalogenase
VDIDGIAFDAFGTLFDLESLREPLGDRGFEQFSARLIPWMWHSSASQRFMPMPELAKLALEAAGADPALAERLTSLPPFPDVEPGLDALRGTPLAVLSNGTREGLEELVVNASLGGCFDHLLAADQVERFKPAPEIYALAPRAFHTSADRVLLVSSNEWDVTGAAAAGMRTAWVARGREPDWVLGTDADVVLGDLTELAAAV